MKGNSFFYELFRLVESHDGVRRQVVIPAQAGMTKG